MAIRPLYSMARNTAGSQDPFQEALAMSSAFMPAKPGIVSVVFVLYACLFFPLCSGAQADSYRDAEFLIHEHQWDQALALLATVLKQEPHNLKALNMTGLALIGKGEAEQANEYFQRAIALDPRFVPALKNFSINEYNEGHDSIAERYLVAAEKIAPDDQVIHFYLGRLAYQNRQYARAIQQYILAADLLSRSPEAKAQLAVAYLQTHGLQAAETLLDSLQPDQVDPQTQFALALVLDDMGLYERSAVYLRNLRSMYPESYEIGYDLMIADLGAKDLAEAIQTGKGLIASRYETSELDDILAQAYEQDHEFKDAVKTYERAVQLDPNNEQNYIDLTSFCINQHQFEAGMAVVQSGLALYPKSARLIFMRGLIYLALDNFEAADDDFRLSEKLSPQRDLGSIGLGASALQDYHGAEAISILRARLRHDPNNAMLLYLLGEALLQNGTSPESASYKEAKTSLEKSIKINPGFCLPHIYLGEIYMDEGRIEDAVSQFEEARKIDPTERSAYSHLAVAYRKLKEPDKAKQILTILQGMVEAEHSDAPERFKAQRTGMVDQKPGADQPTSMNH